MLIGQQRLIQLFPVETVYSSVAYINQRCTRGFEGLEIAFRSGIPVDIEFGKLLDDSYQWSIARGTTDGILNVLDLMD